MTLIKREDAIDAICKEWCYVTYGNCPHVDDGFVCDGCDDVKALNALPSAEPSLKAIKRQIDEHWYLDPPSAEAVQGEWIEKEVMVDEDTNITEWQSARCSVCGKYHTTPFMYYFDNFNFCPNCGAKMTKSGYDE